MILLGVVANVAALAMLRAAWVRQRGGVLMLVAWLCVATGIVSFFLSRGERGVAESVLLFTSLAAALIGVLFLRAPCVEPNPAKVRSMSAPSTFGRRVALLGVSAFASTIAALSLSALSFVLGLRVGWEEADAIVTGVLLASVVWPIALCWLLMEQSVAIRSAIMLALLVLGVGGFVLA